MFTKPTIAIFVLALWLISAVQAQSVDDTSPTQGAGYEGEIVAIIKLLKQGKLAQALSSTDQHLAKFPKSRIAHLLRADTLTAMAGGLSEVGENAPAQVKEQPPTQNQSITIAKLTRQLKRRWQHAMRSQAQTQLQAPVPAQAQAQAQTQVPASLIHLGEHPYVIVTDMRNARLYLYKNNQGQPELVRDYYMSVGSQGYGKQYEGDNKTPIGVYAINRYIQASQLPDLYGKGAFPVDYPNHLDRYRQRTGYGIWLHGTPSHTYARSPWASRGCFVLSNDDFEDIDDYLDADDRTPVILSETIQWISHAELAQRQQQYLAVLKTWEQDWESLDTAAHLQHYAREDFNFGQGDFAQWSARKQQVGAGKTFVEVDVSVKSLFAYPGEQDMFVVNFHQRYHSNNYQSEVHKQQYWQRDATGQWRILFEEYLDIELS